MVCNIQDVLNILNKYNGSFNVLFSGIVAISTVIYAILTCRLVIETIKLRQAQTEPIISISIESKEQNFQLLDLIIKNIGSGPAYNISFKFSEEIKFIPHNVNISEKAFLKHGIKYLKPNQEMKIIFAIGSRLTDDDLKKEFSITTNYENINRKEKYSESFYFNMLEFKDLNQISKPSLSIISEKIISIDETLKKIIDGRNNINIKINKDKY